MLKEDKIPGTETKTGGKVIEKLKSLNPKEKSLFVKLAICLVIGIVLMIISKGCTTADNNAPAEDTAALAQTNISANADYSDEAALETKVADILAAVKGAGKVSVAITYENGPESVYAMNSSEKIADSTSESSSAPAEIDSSPVLIKQNLPAIKGVVVVAEGAGDALVQERLYRAVKSLLKLNSQQIAVIEGNISCQ